MTTAFWGARDAGETSPSPRMIRASISCECLGDPASISLRDTEGKLPSLLFAAGPSQGPLRAPSHPRSDHVRDLMHAIPATDLACTPLWREGAPACASETVPCTCCPGRLFHVAFVALRGPGGPVVSKAGVKKKNKKNTALSPVTVSLRGRNSSAMLRS